MSLAVANFSTAEGTVIKQMTPVDSTNQEWVITDIGKGYCEISSVKSGKALNVVNSSGTVGEGIEQRTFSNISSQKWQFIKDKNGYFQIKNYNSKLCLDIYSASTVSGVPIIQWTGGIEDNQKFSLTKLKDPQLIVVPNTFGNVSVFPNPNNDGYFKIAFTDITGRPLVEIYDMQGKLLYKTTLTEASTNVNSGLSSGVYILKINNNLSSKSQKLIVK